MGYFNYFIKCIIRNISYKLCKPKVFLTVLFCIVILFTLHTKGYCADWTDGEIQACLDGISTITNNQGVIISQLSSMGVNVTDIENQLNNVKNLLQEIDNNTDTIETKIYDVYLKLDTINNNITSIISTLNTNQAELLEQLKEDNKNIVNELQLIRDALNGSPEENFPFVDNGDLMPNTTDVWIGRLWKLRYISPNYESQYTYTVRVTYDSTVYNNTLNIWCLSTDNLIPNNFVIDDYSPLFKRIASVPAGNSSYVVEYIIPSNNPKYIYFGWASCIKNIEIVGSIDGLANSLNKGNDLQQEQNQLQQEQNDFLKQETTDADVSIDSFDNIDSNDITSSGLTGIFTTIYNSISSWNSKNIVFPISFAGTSMTVPGNLTENFILSIGGQPILTIIHTVYYFIVARFIIYSITSIINSIKSGSILNTDTKNNITTDML